MKISEILVKAKALIDTPEKWVQGVLNDGCRFCSVGAVDKVVGDRYPLYKKVVVALYQQLPKQGTDLTVSGFNDTHTHAEVMELFDKAIKESQQHEDANTRTADQG